MLSRRGFIGGAIAAASVSNVLPGRSLSQESRTAQESTSEDLINSRIEGVLVGVQSASFTFSGMGLVEIVATMRAVGLSTIDIMSEHVESFLGAPVLLPGEGRAGPWVPRPKMPPGTRASFPPFTDSATREALREWRLSVDLNRFREVYEMFRVSGLSLFSYNLSFDDSFTDPEIERGFLMTKALGTKIVTASSPVDIFPRLKPFADRHNVIVALHNHTLGPDDSVRTMAIPGNFWVNLDVGHFFASGYDPVSFIGEHYARITNLLIKDRTKNNGDSVPFGDGDTPLPAVFRLVKSKRLTFPNCIEYVGPAGPPIELTSCRQYCKDAIRSV